MRRTEQVQGLRLMKFEEVYGRTASGWLEPGGGGGGSGCLGAHLIRRWRDRYEAQGADGLYDRYASAFSVAARAGGRGGAGAGVVRHPLLGLHGQALPREAGGRSRLQAQLQLAAAELASPWAQARGAQAWGAPAQAAAPCPARMMLHQDGSSHEWVPGRWWDLIVTKRCDRDIYCLLRRRRGLMSSFQGVSDGDPGQGPVLLALRQLERQPLLEHARWPAARWTRTPRPRSAAPWRARIELIPPTRPRQGGARSACSAPCRSACFTRNSGSPASTDMVEANASSRRAFLQHNARFATPADRGTAFVPFTGRARRILCIHEERTVSNDNTVRYKRPLQNRHRRHYVKARVRVHEYPDGTRPSSMDRDSCAIPSGQPIDSQTREAA